MLKIVGSVRWEVAVGPRRWSRDWCNAANGVGHLRVERRQMFRLSFDIRGLRRTTATQPWIAQREALGRAMPTKWMVRVSKQRQGQVAGREIYCVAYCPRLHWLFVAQKDLGLEGATTDDAHFTGLVR